MSGMQEFRQTTTTTIANGASQSAAIDLTDRGRLLLCIQMPAAWTAANITFLASNDGVTYGPVYDQYLELTVYNVAALAYLAVPYWKFMGMRYLKIRSGTAGTPVNQGAGRTLTLVIGS